MSGNKPSFIFTVVLLATQLGLGETSECKLAGVFFKLNSTTLPLYNGTDPVKYSANDVKANVCSQNIPKSCCDDKQSAILKKCQDDLITRRSTELIALMKDFEGTFTKANQDIIVKLAATTSMNRRRRRLQTSTYDPKIFINQFLSKYEFSPRLVENLKTVSKKCWSFYIDTIQAGMSCSLCSITDNQMYNITVSTFQPIINLQNCDLLIARCFRTIDMHTKLTEFMRNVIYLMLQKTGQGSAILANYLKLYPQQDTKGVVEACGLEANCDGLCREIFKMGSFDNPFIFGNARIYETFNRFAAGDAESKRNQEKPFDTSTGIKENILYKLNPTYVPTDIEISKSKMCLL